MKTRRSSARWPQEGKDVGKDSAIEWTSHTFNPWRGCTKVSEGCKNCYAETLSARNPKTLGVWGPKGSRVMASESYWRQPLTWNAAAQAFGERRRVFCASLADVFEGRETMPAEAWPEVLLARERLWYLIEETPHLDWLLLTKRPENIQANVFPLWWEQGFPANVWVGTSCENQEAADQRIPHLLRVPAQVRFLSCEPLIGPISLHQATPCNGYYCDESVGHIDCRYWRDHLHWVIVGGESGTNARPMHPDWARSLRDQCQSAAGVPFFFKQHGEWVSGRAGLTDGDWHKVTGKERFQFVNPPGANHQTPYTPVYKVGKKAAGRLLDGREWNEFPEVRK